MFKRNKKARKYQAPSAKVTQMALESNFCQTVRFRVKVKSLENVNDDDEAAEAEYFDPLVS